MNSKEKKRKYKPSYSSPNSGMFDKIKNLKKRPYKPSYDKENPSKVTEASYNESDKGFLPELIDTYNKISNFDIVLLNNLAPYLTLLFYTGIVILTLIILISVILIL